MKKPSKPEYIDVREGYSLGNICRSYISDNGELLEDVDIEVLVSYQKKTISGNKFVLGEHVSFEDRQGRRHEYFSYDDNYGGVVSKWTTKDGEIERELRTRDHRKEPLNLTKFENGIIDKLKNLPAHVRNVFGL